MIPIFTKLLQLALFVSGTQPAFKDAKMVGQTNLDKAVVLVTGGSGLVGEAVKYVVNNEVGRFGAESNEEWIFLRSKDGNLT